MIVRMCMCMSVDRLAPLAALGFPAREVTPPQLALLTRHTLQLCVRELAPATRAYNERGRGNKVGAAIASNASKMPLTQQSGQ